MATQKCGGTTSVEKVTQEVEEICEKIRPKLESKVGPFKVYVPLTYRSQVVAGTNYFVKIRVDEEDKHIHVRIFKPLPHAGQELELVSFQEKTASDKLEYF